MSSTTYGTAHNDYYKSYTAVGTQVGGLGTVDAKNEDLIPYFGIPNNPEQLKGDNAFVTRRQLPFAYKDKNILLSTKIEGLVIKNPEEILSAQYGAPPTKTDSLKFSVVSYYFDEGMLDVEPEEGVARHQRFAQRKASGTLIRKSKGMHFEHGFLYTEEGRKLYQLQQVQFANNVVNDMIYHTLYALRESRHQSVEFEARDGIYPDDFRECVLQKNKEFACFQKYPKAASNLLSKIENELLNRAGVLPNAVICSRGLEYFWSDKAAEILANEKTGAPVSDSNPLTVTRKNDLKLIFTRLFQNKVTGQLPIDPLIRERVNGEYYLMAPHTLEQMEGQEYKSSHRTIKIMDFEKRRWGAITLEHALLGSPIFNEAGITLINDGGMDKNNSLFTVLDEATNRPTQCEMMGELPQSVLPFNFFKKMVEVYSSLNGLVELGPVLQPEDEEARLNMGLAAKEMSVLGKRSSTERSSNLLIPVTINSKTASPMEVSVTLDDIHAQNKSLLAGNLATASLSSAYDSILSSKGIDAEKFATKVNRVLQDTDPNSTDVLRSNMTLLSDPDTMVKKRTEAIKYFNEGVSIASLGKSATKESFVSKSSSKIFFVTPSFYETNSSNLELYAADSDHPDGVYDMENYADMVSLTELKSGTKSGADLNLQKLKKNNHIATNWAIVMRAIPAGQLGYARTLMQMRINMNTFKFLIQNNIPFPLAFIIFRPWMTWVTSTIIALRGGSDTIVNFYMPPDVMLQDDATTKTHSAHVTMHLAPFVKAPGNIKVVDDVAVRRYLSGGNVIPYGPNDLKEMAIMSRWEPRQEKGSPSFFALPISMTEANKLDSVIDFRGYFFGSNRETAEPHFVTCHTTFEKAVFAHPDPQHPYSPPEPETFVDVGYNSVCTQGTQLCYNYSTKDWTAIIRGDDSPWSGMVYPEMTRVIEGMEKLLNPPDYGDISKYPPFEMYH